MPYPFLAFVALTAAVNLVVLATITPRLWLRRVAAYLAELAGAVAISAAGFPTIALVSALGATMVAVWSAAQEPQR